MTVDLQTAIQLKSDRIRQSQLIQKLREIAQTQGSGGKIPGEWANAQYRFCDDVFEIDYEVFAMGDEQLRVIGDEKQVFYAAERVTTLPKPDNPKVNVDGHRTFEILIYEPGIWEQRVKEIYQKLCTAVSC